MKFLITAIILITMLVFMDMARAMIPPTKGHNSFCQFDPYNHPVLSLSEYDIVKKLKGKHLKTYLEAHMIKQCGYIPKGSVK